MTKVSRTRTHTGAFSNWAVAGYRTLIPAMAKKLALDEGFREYKDVSSEVMVTLVHAHPPSGHQLNSLVSVVSISCSMAVYNFKKAVASNKWYTQFI